VTAELTDPKPAQVTRVVVGVDGSEPARHAALWAADEAAARGVPLTVLHAAGVTEAVAPAIGPVPDPGLTPTQGDRLIETTLALVREGHPHLPVDAQSSPLAPLERLTELSGPDTLTVVGTRGHGALVGTLLGSISRALVKHTRGPLVVVRGPHPDTDAATATAAAPSGRVVLGVADEPGPRAAQYAFDTAARYGADVQAIRTRSPLPPSPGVPGAIDLPVVMPAGGGIRATIPPADDVSQDERDEAAERDENLVAVAIAAARAQYPHVPVDTACLEGDAAMTLTASGQHARLIVLSAPRGRHHGGFSLSPGHVVGKLLAHSPAPIAIIPETEPDTDPDQQPDQAADGH